ncbi:PREDICTED: XK-related protein 4-like isoform X2 [Rhagoletis zephyria]|uniref:XK-related protein 4-like isoform X2 n=1 Tax=Rhagoletis zephyria TaxID=28612 RepID=UPI000811244F|nr:PREDICTED: XK-related protein 4-like isoform X2 [Rhagoletis zephyria]
MHVCSIHVQIGIEIMENITSILDLMRLTRQQCMRKSNLPECIETDADGADADGVDAGTHAWKEKTVSFRDIAATVISILMRVITVLLNIKLAVEYHQQGEHSYFVWTVVCMIVPMCVTALIYAQMYYKLTTKEESDVALIRLFECFMETAPQKILLMSIILTQSNQITDTQVWSVLLYLANVPWTLGTYNRCIRAAQTIKNKLSYWLMAPHLCWHFCISVSRTLCITFIAVLFPIWTIVACVQHAVITGFVTYILERPQFCGINAFHNFLFCIALGFIYIFIYIPVKEAPTRYKYALYYAICSVENIICVVLFIYYAPKRLSQSKALFYTLCTLAIGFYYVGICCMCIYYIHFHPNVKARKNMNIDS